MTLFFNTPNRKNAPVVALHSSASSAYQWTALQAQFEDFYDFYAWDLPGYGTTCDRDMDAKGFARVAQPIIKKIEALGTTVHLIGHSFGGAVAIKIALLRPDLIKSLTLYEPAAFHILRAATPEGHDLFDGLAHCAQNLSAKRSEEGVQNFIDFWNGPHTWASMPAERREKMAKLAPSLLEDFEDLNTEDWSLADLAGLEVPTLVIMGMESPALAQDTANLVAEKVPGAELALLPELGHMAPISDPEWVNPRILQHVARVQKAAAHVRWPARSAA